MSAQDPFGGAWRLANRLQRLLIAIAVLACAATTWAEEPAYRVEMQRSTHETPIAPYAAEAYDSKRGAVVVFGGTDRENPEGTARVMRLDLGTGEWSTIETSGPAPKAVVLPALAYDPKRDALFLFGGWARGAGKPVAELWTLPLGVEGKTAWKLRSPTGNTPPARNGCVMLHDAKRDRLLLHGGDGGPHPEYGFTPLDDLWAYDLAGEKWTRLGPKGDIPQPRWNHAGTIVPQQDRIFIFGGAGYAGESLVLDRQGFALDIETLEWTQLGASEKLPPALQAMSLTYDPRADVLVVVGGLSMEETGPVGPTRVWLRDMGKDTWIESTQKLRLTRRGHVAVYDPRAKTHVICGGETVTWRGNFFAPGTRLRDTISLSIVPE
jgi:hypothetical protein